MRAIPRSAVSILLLLASCAAAQAAPGRPAAAADTLAGRCVTCHKRESPGLYRQWLGSAHGRQGITCLDCHAAQRGEPDAFRHEGAWVATLVTPRDCGACHDREAAEVAASHHAQAGQILESADAYMAHAVGGHPAAIAGCESCHGGQVRIDPAAPNRLARESWPNSGIGRINPDGSQGACNACHTRHSFDKAQARRPEACGKCHLGPDHPQKEVYEESKHGNAYYTHLEAMNLEADRWVVGLDYFEAPTCATCHLSATEKLDATHDVGRRISWTLRPPVSTLLDGWQQKRADMQQVCSACHHREFVRGHYFQYDGVVRLYNEKFAKPAGALMDLVRAEGLLENPSAFGNEIEWIYWEIWHHEGRRARHGAAMMGPDYTWWHGIYDVAQHFYFDFLPAAREYDNAAVDGFVERLLRDDPMHQWIGRPTEEIRQDIRSGRLPGLYRDLFRPE